jgi:hypothetical protein
MGSVAVKFGRSFKTCSIAGNGTCRVCGKEITWGQITETGKYVPLDPAPVSLGVM